MVRFKSAHKQQWNEALEKLATKYTQKNHLLLIWQYIITEKELIQILILYYPALCVGSPQLVNDFLDPNGGNLEAALDGPSYNQTCAENDSDTDSSRGPALIQELQSIEKYAQINLWDPQNGTEAEIWGKAMLANGRLLRSKISDMKGPPPVRFYQWFEVQTTLQSLKMQGCLLII
jgi:hypothetical protein